MPLYYSTLEFEETAEGWPDEPTGTTYNINHPYCMNTAASNGFNCGAMRLKIDVDENSPTSFEGRSCKPTLRQFRKFRGPRSHIWFDPEPTPLRLNSLQ
jgi:hypothetical protein